MNKPKSFVRGNILLAITREREYQDKKWGTIEQNPHTLGEWLLIMEHELHEATRAWINSGDRDALKELLQVISVGFACLEQHGIVERGRDEMNDDLREKDVAATTTGQNENIIHEQRIAIAELRGRLDSAEEQLRSVKSDRDLVVKQRDYWAARLEAQEIPEDEREPPDIEEVVAALNTLVSVDRETGVVTLANLSDEHFAGVANVVRRLHGHGIQHKREWWHD